jgi:hypothetical protein
MEVMWMRAVSVVDSKGRLLITMVSYQEGSKGRLSVDLSLRSWHILIIVARRADVKPCHSSITY